MYAVRPLKQPIPSVYPLHKEHWKCLMFFAKVCRTISLFFQNGQKYTDPFTWQTTRTPSRISSEIRYKFIGRKKVSNTSCTGERNTLCWYMRTFPSQGLLWNNQIEAVINARPRSGIFKAKQWSSVHMQRLRVTNINNKTKLLPASIYRSTGTCIYVKWKYEISNGVQRGAVQRLYQRLNIMEFHGICINVISFMPVRKIRPFLCRFSRNS
jgi:hypothetical protein